MFVLYKTKKQNMHILKIIHGYPMEYNAGSEVYTQSIVEELSKSHKISLFTREENEYKADFNIRKTNVNDNFTKYHINMPRAKDGYRHEELDCKFEDLLLEIKPDIAHIGHLNHLSTGIVDVLNKHNIPIVFTLHDFWLMCPRGQFLQIGFGKNEPYDLCTKQENSKCASNCYNRYFSGTKDMYNEDLQYWTKWIDRRMTETKSLCSKVDHFIAPSRYLMNRFIDDFKISTNKIEYLDYGFPTHYLDANKIKKSNRPFTFGYIGTHIPSKGLNLLIEAFTKIEQKSGLKIFGRAIGQNTAALKKMALNCNNEIEFLGEYDNKNLVEEVFSKVDAIVTPSIWGENSPLVIHEAQACKIPVITADFGGMKEYVSHLENGLLFKHRDSNDLLSKMQFAIDNKSKMTELGSRGYLFSDDSSVPDITEHCAMLEEIYTDKLNIKQQIV